MHFQREQRACAGHGQGGVVKGADSAATWYTDGSTSPASTPASCSSDSRHRASPGWLLSSFVYVSVFSLSYFLSLPLSFSLSLSRMCVWAREKERGGERERWLLSELWASQPLAKWSVQSGIAFRSLVGSHVWSLPPCCIAPASSIPNTHTRTHTHIQVLVG